MRRMTIRSAAAVTILAAISIAAVGRAGACALDGVPSLTADGQLDRIVTDPPTTSAQLATWAPFVVPRSFRVNQSITFTELRGEVARSLTASAMVRPWHWEFGDGRTTVGWTVKHGYAHPGHWRIVVYAYSPVDRQWHDFDHVTITIVPAPRAKHR